MDWLLCYWRTTGNFCVVVSMVVSIWNVVPRIEMANLALIYIVHRCLFAVWTLVLHLKQPNYVFK